MVGGMKSGIRFDVGWVVLCLLFPLFNPPVVHAAPAKARLSRVFLWVEADPADLKRANVPILEREGKKAMTTLSPAQFQSLLKQRISLIVREAVELPLPKPYLSLAEVEAEMLRLSKAYPKHVELVNVSQRFKVPPTADGRSVLALRIHASQSSEPAPTVLLDSIHHAREVITPLVLLDAAKTLAEEYGKDPKVTRWVDHYDIWLIPIVNPDGYHYMFSTDPFWRKNRRKNSDGTFGVDLNRNYPFQWGTCGSNSPKGESEIYKGSAPASEPEVQAMVALGAAIQPQLYLTYHSYGNDVVRPYVCATVADETLVQSVTQSMATAAGYKFRKASSSGESFEHYYNRYGSLSYLIEVGTEFHPKPTDAPMLIAKARTTWMTLLERGMQTAVLLQVVDKATQQPVLADLRLDEIKFVTGEVRRTLAKNGFFAWTLAPGSYTLRVSAAGYKPWSKSLSLTSSSLLRLKVELEAGGVDSTEAGVEEAPHSPEASFEASSSEKSGEEPQLDRASSSEVAPSEDGKPRSESQDKVNDGNVSPDAPLLEKPSGQGCECSTGESWSWTWGLLLLLGFYLLRRLRSVPPSSSR
ncbi:MAG: hypothetical protein EP343_11985 [Deltaproteobacteria bacterium]|nr:MAG: hypothetical protein EP343_11985 [Deltaproteobacteria bacterium]